MSSESQEHPYPTENHNTQSESQEPSEGGDYLAFTKNNDGNKAFRNNFQHRSYYRNRNQGNHNFRRNQHFGGRNDGDGQFAPANSSSPVGFNSHQQRLNNGFHNRPNHNYYQNRNRNFTPYKVSLSDFFFSSKRCILNNLFYAIDLITPFLCHSQKFGANNQKTETPIQQYFHISMLEDPWVDCHQFNGTKAPESAHEGNESNLTETPVDT